MSGSSRRARRLRRQFRDCGKHVKRGRKRRGAYLRKRYAGYR